MNPKISKEAEYLFSRTFAFQAPSQGCLGSRCDLDDGTAALWGQLAREGLIEPWIPGPIGHNFSIKPTEAGRYFLRLRGNEPLNGAGRQPRRKLRR